MKSEEMPYVDAKQKARASLARAFCALAAVLTTDYWG
jgi:hypothetical protein